MVEELIANVFRMSLNFHIFIPLPYTMLIIRVLVGRERVGTAFPHFFHVLLKNEFEAVKK